MEHGAHSHGDHGGDKHAGHDPEMFRRRFWLSLVLTLPVVFWSQMIQDWFGYQAPEFTGSFLIAPVLGTLIFVYGGSPFLTGAYHEIRSRQPGMMLLIAMAISVAFGASVATSLGWADLDFWWELAALVTIMLLGHWQEMAAIGAARGALDALAELLPDTAERIDADGNTETVAAGDLSVGDRVLVRPGTRVPADGRIVDGEADFDESMITGESRPVLHGVGEEVVAGTVSVQGAVTLEVTAIGEDTALAGIGRLVAAAQTSTTRAQALADRFAAALFYVAVLVAVITLAVWSLLGNPDAGIVRTVTVLVIACPHALGLAIPLVVSLSTAISARQGILVSDRMALERMRGVDTVLFDKTGTLTQGSHELSGVVTAGDWQRQQVLALAAATESASEHPLARAIVAAARDEGDVPRAQEFSSMTGRGVSAQVEGRAVSVGGPALLAEMSLEEPGELADELDAWRSRGSAVLYVIADGQVAGALSLDDAVRPEARRAVADLAAMGISTAMITGDAEGVAQRVAGELGIPEVMAQVLPEDKDARVAELQSQGRVVAMVGDGVNDAPALARADVGIAIGAGTDVAVSSAGVVLASDDPRGVASVVRLSRATYRKMVQNLAWAAGYNVVAIPLAAGVLAWAGIVIGPAVGAVLMSASTIIVALNAQLLRRVPLGSSSPEPAVTGP